MDGRRSNNHLPEARLRQACAELDRRLREDPACRAESFLEQFPEIAGSDESALELIYTEFTAREELGQQPTTEEYLDRFPRWRAGLREQFRLHELLGTEGLIDSLAAFSVRRPPTAIKSAGAESRRAGTAPDAERSIGAYGVLEEIGRGSGGVVYKARHQALNRLVALKMMLVGACASSSEQSRLRHEAEAAARLQHPNIVQIFEVGEDHGNTFLALEYVPGGTLATKLAGKPQRADAAARLLETLARAVDHAHGQGIIHRDLKPANVLLAADGTPKITDFGVAKFLDSQEVQTATGSIVGTPCYMAPEQAAGHVASAGAACDVYALGAILYEMLTGRPPFRAQSLLETLRQVAEEDPLPPERLQAGIPRDAATICLKCLRKEPLRRYAGAAALADDLHRFQVGEPILARPTGPWERAWKWARRRPSTAVFVGVSIVAGLCLLLGSLWYNARLSDAVADARGQRTEAERQRAAAVARSEVIQKQFDYARRTMLTMQLARVEDAWMSDSTRARKLLEDGDRCAPDLRDFAWGLFHDLCTRDQVLELPRNYGVQTMAMTPDAKTLATVGRDGNVRLWNLASGTETALLPGHGRAVPYTAFSPDGRLLVSGDGDGAVRLWDVATGRTKRVWKGHTAQIQSVAFSPDGTTVASGGVDRTVRLWGVDEQNVLGVLSGYAHEVVSLAFSPDSRILASCSFDPSVHLWDVAGRKELESLSLGDGAMVSWVSYTPDGKQLAVLDSHTNAVSFWDVESRRRVRELSAYGSLVRAAALAPDGLSLATANDDQLIRICDSNTGIERYKLWTDRRPVARLQFSQDGRKLAALTDDGAIFHLWSTEIRQSSAPGPAHERQRITCIAASSDGGVLASGDSDGKIRLWDAQTLKERAPFETQDGRLSAMAIAPNGLLLAAAGEEPSPRIWNLATRRVAQVLRGHRGPVRALAFSPDGATLATASDDGTVKLWDPAGGRMLATLRANDSPMTAVTFSPDGRSLITGSADGAVRRWDAARRTLCETRDTHHAVLFAVYSRDGRHLATGGPEGTVDLWELNPFAVRFTLHGDSGFAFSAAFTPDGQTLATGSGLRGTVNVPGEVKLWDVTTGQCRATLRGQTGPVCFASAGHALATIDNFTAVRFWSSTIERDSPH